jgi:hypothetical protein
MTGLVGRWRILSSLTAALMAASCAAETRYGDVLYLSEWKQPPLSLKVLHRAPVTRTRNSNSVMAYLAPGQTVEVVGVGEGQDYIKARIATGPVQGWVDAGALEFPPRELLAELRERRERTEARRDLVEHHEVVVGMTSAEVRASLGKPSRRTQVHGKQGDEEQWRYVVYQHVPHYEQRLDANGQWRSVVSYQRVESGQKVIRFRKDEVIEITDEPTEQSPAPARSRRPLTP